MHLTFDARRAAQNTSFEEVRAGRVLVTTTENFSRSTCGRERALQAEAARCPLQPPTLPAHRRTIRSKEASRSPSAGPPQGRYGGQALRAAPLPPRSRSPRTREAAAAKARCANCGRSARSLIQRCVLRLPPSYASVKASPPLIKTLASRDAKKMAEQGPLTASDSSLRCALCAGPHKSRAALRWGACVVRLLNANGLFPVRGGGCLINNGAPPARLPYRFLLFLHPRGHLRHSPVDGDAVVEVGHVLAAVDGQRFGGV